MTGELDCKSMHCAAVMLVLGLGLDVQVLVNITGTAVQYFSLVYIFEPMLYKVSIDG
jgi:hypothetical protein